MATRKPTRSRRPHQSGDKSPSWKGGRVVASNGYVLIMVGHDHHLADVRGYAYEHRLVAEQMLGRRLRPGEQVHHKNKIKTDNQPENLEVCASGAEHMVKHRSEDSVRQLPDEPNEIVYCACGCGEAFPRYDEDARPRLYISGHNLQPSPTIDAVISCLRSGPAPRRAIARLVNKSAKAVAAVLNKLKRRGVAFQVSHGVWLLREAKHATDGNRLDHVHSEPFEVSQEE